MLLHGFATVQHVDALYHGAQRKEIRPPDSLYYEVVALKRADRN